ncbi:hypothetical protein POV27_07095 [Aureisphaera galaxeae]|uniref:hypothetical protein n=1 Tax=Aureisphaera galaxeae TaxID=1538023 RepID=UPI0023510298|nr:hypothetical protein [Aureisphaera galaxeae]MDC8003811.1 hypothetical protein [Aureisphaera galaxeae]
MKSILKKSSLLFLCAALLFSCRSEETQFVQEDSNQVLGANANVKTLIQNTVTNDGSYDNIIDGGSCFDIQLPVTVIANGIEVIITTENDVDQVEAIFDEFPDDVDTLEINFPITIIDENYDPTIINSQAELNAAALQCGPDNSPDDDIECIDFQYPITANIFDQNNEQVDTVVFNNDEELFDFVDDIDEDLIIVFQFPITVIFSDGSTQAINDFEELENVIEEAADDCDEDDDNDPDDDDCEDCTVDELEDFITGCDEWTVDKLERNDEDLEDQYVGYDFTFNEDGTITVVSGSDSFSGTWEAEESADEIILELNIPNLPDFNDAWILHELEVYGDEHKFDLRLGDDRLRFESDCNEVGDGPDDGALVDALTTGDWYITYYFDDEDETADFADYVFNFDEDGTATADNGIDVTDGIWTTAEGDETDLELGLNFGDGIPLDELAEDWDVLEVTMDIIRLKDVSGDGTDDFLTFERDPFDGGGGDSDLADILSDGIWEVALYTDDGSDETIDYEGYDITFDIDGTVTADNGSNTNNGTWEALNADNTLLLDFGADFPFDEFNDDWDVLSVSDTMVELQDVSGGGGGTDVLILEKQ